MKVKVKWGITPVNKDQYLPEKIFGEEIIEVNSINHAKKRAKSLANSCDKIKDTYSNYTRTWIYWQNWQNQDKTTSKVLSYDKATIEYNNLDHEYTAFISISQVEGSKNQQLSLL